MTEVKVPSPESLELEKIHDLIRSSGPCITLLVPPYRPGEQSKPIAGMVRTNLQVARHQLEERNIAGNITDLLLEPLEELARDPDFLAGSHWSRVIFRSRDVLRQFTLTDAVKPGLFVGGYFEVRPILAELDLPAEFYVLKISKKSVDLHRSAALNEEPLKLPAGVPQTLEEALEFERPDHDLENRSVAGASTGSMPGVRFGTGSGRETQSAYLADFYKAVDRGVRELLGLRNAPLVLAGVDEDTALYRAHNRYANLLARSVSGNQAGSLLENGTLQKAYEIVRADRAERAVNALLDAKERVAPARFTTGLSGILRAAVEGRVARLYIDQAARMFGLFEGARRSGRWNWGEEDLLNIAAVETLLEGGSAYSLPTGRIPDGAPIAAILRY